MLSWTELVTICLVSGFVYCDDSQFRGHRIYRLTIPEEAVPFVLKALDSGENEAKYDVLRAYQPRDSHLDVMVRPSALKEFKQLIQTYKVSAQILDDDVERSIRCSRQENRRAMSRPRSRRSVENFFSHDAYFPFAKMEANLREVAKTVRNASLEELGRTAENRSIWLLKISRDNSLPIIWIDAGIHAREWIAPASAFYVIDKLLSREGFEMLQKYQFYIAPEVNPDGYDFSFTRNRYWRKNRNRTTRADCYGVDLNRNFPFKWGFNGSSSDPCSEVFKGLSAADQAETQSIIRKLASIANQTKLYITLHSYGQLILLPYGFQRGQRPAQYDELLRLSVKVIHSIWKQYGNVYSTGTAADLLYPASGGSDDFACGPMRIPYTYTFELPDLGSYNFLLPPSYITSVGKEVWTALKVLVSHMKPHDWRIDDS